MKNRVFLLLALCGCCGTWSCDDGQATNTKSTWLTAEQIENNATLLDSAFSLTINALGSNDKVKKLATASESEEDFISEMNRLTKDVFDESIGIAWKIKSEPYRNPESNAAQLIGYNLNPQIIDPLRSFATAIEEDAAGQNDHTGHLELLSVSHANVVEALEGFELIMEHDDPQALDNAIDDFLAEHHEPVLMALLLPAVQKVREAARRHTRKELFDIVVDPPIISSYQSALFIQQQNAAGYLGGLDLLVSGEFKRDNEKFVCIETMRAIYLNTTAQLWHQAWKVYR